MAYFIFDLDGTVVDTSHRYRNGPDGHIDLEFWFANSTPEMIAKDKLLPLAVSWRALYKIGHKIVVCTARDFSDNPKVPTKNIGKVYEQFLFDNRLYYSAMLHRTMAGPEHETMGDGELKIKLLGDYFRSEGFDSPADAEPVMWDDNVKVIAAMQSIGVHCYDAVQANAAFAAKGGRYG